MAHNAHGSDSQHSPGAELCHRLEASRAKLMTAISGLQNTEFRARSIEGAWTPAELLSHLYSTEHIFIERARKGIEEPGYAVTPVSQAVREEHIGMAKRMPVPQIIHGLLAQRRDTLEFVHALSEQDLTRKLQHPVRGEQSVVWQIENTIEHEVEHAEELSSRRAETAGANR